MIKVSQHPIKPSNILIEAKIKRNTTYDILKSEVEIRNNQHRLALRNKVGIQESYTDMFVPACFEVSETVYNTVDELKTAIENLLNS